MDLKNGYKQTDVGVIPEDWDTPTLGELFSFKNGLNKSKGSFGRGTPIVNYMDVYSHPGIHAGDLRGLVEVSKGELESLAVKKGDVFFTRTSETVAEVGIASVMLDDSPNTVFSGFILRARPLNDAICDQYKKYCFSSDIVRKQITSKATYTTRALTSGRILSAISLPLPPTKAEQEAIARVLSDADALTESLGQLVAKKRDIKQAVMQELLTGRKRLPGFGLSWKVCLLADIGTFAKGRGIKKDDIVDDGMPCIRYGEIYTHYNDYAMQFYSHISPEIAKGSQRIGKGDILFTGSGETAEEIGKCVAYLGEGEAYAGGDIIIFSPIGNDSLFLSYLTNHTPSVVNQKARFGQGDAVVHISKRNLALLRLQLPESQDEQRAIASNLINMDAEIDMLEAEREKITSLKQGMMQSLLTGRIRLV